MSSFNMEQAQRSGMKAWRGLRVGMVSCHRSKSRHRKWRWGRKKGLRRARRRVGQQLIREFFSESV